jgi:sporulation protein YlmC with PRC-barrel domain
MSVDVIKLSHLLELEVQDEDGRSLGHVHDVRVQRGGDGEYVVEGLITGRRGLFVRLGARRARDPAPVSPHDALPWKDVLAIEPDRIVVRRQA